MRDNRPRKQKNWPFGGSQGYFRRDRPSPHTPARSDIRNVALQGAKQATTTAVSHYAGNNGLAAGLSAGIGRTGTRHQEVLALQERISRQAAVCFPDLVYSYQVNSRSAGPTNQGRSRPTTGDAHSDPFLVYTHCYRANDTVNQVGRPVAQYRYESYLLMKSRFGREFFDRIVVGKPEFDEISALRNLTSTLTEYFTSNATRLVRDITHITPSSALSKGDVYNTGFTHNNQNRGQHDSEMRGRHNSPQHPQSGPQNPTRPGRGRVGWRS